MNLPHNIKKAPDYWDRLPYFKRVRGLLFFNYIYLRADIYDDLKSENPDPYNQSILVHEETHRSNAQRQGWFKYGFKYIFSKKARLEEELSAIKAQILFLQSKGIEYSYVDRSARALSSVYYLWAGDYSQIKEELENFIKDSH